MRTSLARARRSEEIWLAAFVRSGNWRLSVAIETQDALRLGGWSYLDILSAVRNGRLSGTEPDPSGAQWVVVGPDTDGRTLGLELRVEVASCRVEVIHVWAVRGDDDA